MTDIEIKTLKEAIENANVISFDIFDTLLFRKVNRPEDIFVMLENAIVFILQHMLVRRFWNAYLLLF